MLFCSFPYGHMLVLSWPHSLGLLTMFCTSIPLFLLLSSCFTCVLGFLSLCYTNLSFIVPTLPMLKCPYLPYWFYLFPPSLICNFNFLAATCMSPCIPHTFSSFMMTLYGPLRAINLWSVPLPLDPV